jgi:Fur family transcriptional regulator, ferric uptake regulator
MKQRDCKKELRRLDLRATPARVAVMSLLEQSEKPIDVNLIIDFLNKKEIKTDPATVFRIINILMQKRIVLPIQFQDGRMRYELTKKRHHHHLVCESCGEIEDVFSHFVPELEKEIEKKHKFLVKRHSLEFFGLCRNCQK